MDYNTTFMMSFRNDFVGQVVFKDHQHILNGDYDLPKKTKYKTIIEVLVKTVSCIP